MMEIKLLAGPTSPEVAEKAARLSFGGKKKRSGVELLSSLQKAGDSHAKSLRGVVVWLEITAPRYWWHEYVTYQRGNQQLGSDSTMNTRRDLSEEELVEAKSNLPEGTEQTRIFMVSYQALRHMYYERRNHRLPEWRQFCERIETLPYAEEWITV